MRHRHLRRLVLIGVLAALAAPTVARADTQPVSATVLSTLGISVSGPVVLTNFAPGQTATGVGTVTVVSTGPWVLRLSDASASNAGHLVRTSGSSGVLTLAQALAWAAVPTLGGTGASGSLSGTPTTAASGTLADVVNVSYSQTVNANEQLSTGSVYGVTVTWTISPT
jgi:hypothetical protein